MVATLAVLAGAAGCVDATRLDAETRARLEAYRLPAAPPPDPSNAVADDPRAATLGKAFYFDPRFSGPLGAANDGVSRGSLGQAGALGRVACASCHDLAAAGSDHRSRPAETSLGAGYVGRNASTVVNAAYAEVARGGWLFWDGRKDSMWSVALAPIESPAEHNFSRLEVVHAIFDHYRGRFEAVFGPLPNLTDAARFPAAGKPGTAAYDGMAAADRAAVDRAFVGFGKAIEAYERRLVSTSFAPSAFDRMLAGELDAMSPAALRGARLFVGRAACDECHRGPAFTDGRFHNIGTPQRGENAPTTDLGRFAGMGVVGDPFNRAGAFSDHRDDTHLVGLAATARDLGAFKTPTLRNAGRTAPYMHDGAYATLWDVVNHYNFGGATGLYAGTREVTIAPLLLDLREVDDLVAFLGALDDGEPLPSADFPEGLTAPPPLPN
jgi:cytochrome c peroxidase